MSNKLIVHGVIRIDGKYLVIKRSEIKRGKANVYPSYFDIPGGSVEFKETPRDALIREIKEEVGLNAIVNDIIHEDSNFDTEKQTVFTRLIYNCTVSCDCDIKLDPEEHTEYRLISSLSELDDELVVPYLKELL